MPLGRPLIARAISTVSAAASQRQMLILQDPPRYSLYSASTGGGHVPAARTDAGAGESIRISPRRFRAISGYRYRANRIRQLTRETWKQQFTRR